MYNIHCKSASKHPQQEHSHYQHYNHNLHYIATLTTTRISIIIMSSIMDILLQSTLGAWQCWPLGPDSCIEMGRATVSKLRRNKNSVFFLKKKNVILIISPRCRKTLQPLEGTLTGYDERKWVLNLHLDVNIWPKMLLGIKVHHHLKYFDHNYTTPVCHHPHSSFSSSSLSSLS